MICRLSSFNKYGPSACNRSLSETHHPIRCRRLCGDFKASTGSRTLAGTARLCLPGLGPEVGEKPGEHLDQRWARWRPVSSPESLTAQVAHEGTARPHLTRVPASGQDVPSWADPSSAEGVVTVGKIGGGVCLAQPRPTSDMREPLPVGANVMRAWTAPQEQRLLGTRPCGTCCRLSDGNLSRTVCPPAPCAHRHSRQSHFTRTRRSKQTRNNATAAIMPYKVSCAITASWRVGRPSSGPWHLPSGGTWAWG